MIGKGYIVNDDLYFVARRLKEIDGTYFVFYNYKKRKYEVHSSGQRGNTLALTVPYGVLDARTVELVRKTRSGRIKQLLAETETENALINLKRRREELKHAENKAEKALSHL